jgi:RimJ/RimL family protein N-acetyltransferase
VDLHALPDGNVVTIRPIQADDGERLQLAHERLSQESRYRRFLSSKPQLTAADTRYLVDIDGCDHYALVATVAEPDGEAIIAVARFVRLPEDRRTAEFAIVVGDAWQRQGVAGELLGRLADAAVTRGVTRFRASMFADNVAIHRLVARLAVRVTNRHRSGNVSEMEFDLPTRRDDAGPMLARHDDAEPAPTRRDDAGPAPAIITACAGG